MMGGERQLLRVEYTYAYLRGNHYVLSREFWSTSKLDEPTWCEYAEAAGAEAASGIIAGLRMIEAQRQEAGTVVIAPPSPGREYDR